MKWWRWLLIIVGALAGSLLVDWIMDYWNGVSVSLNIAVGIGIAAYYDLRARLDSHRHLGYDRAPDNTFLWEKP